jgi:glucan phosphorylase
MKLLDQVRAVIRKKHYSIRTEQAYVAWAKRFILFHGKRHPKDMGEEEISQYISHLATAIRRLPQAPKTRRSMPSSFSINMSSGSSWVTSAVQKVRHDSLFL